jgi:[acyl-carrier-protein] S-malonyltransferase
MSDAILFPGQGAQFEGMGRDWAEAFPEARATFDEADQVLGFSLTDACWSSGDDVNRTDVAQPGIFATSVAIVRALRAAGVDLDGAPLTAGLSLGEYTALWFAGVLSFEDGLKLVRLRGEAMQDASEACPSGMVSLMGASPEQAEALAQVGAAHGICQVANLNSPGQIILSGEFPALDAAEAAAKDHGVRRTRRLVVAGGFHSECMRPAADRLAAALAGTTLEAPRIPVISNVTAAPVEGPDHVRELLARQVCAPVLWERSMRAALDGGTRSFVEPGPGNVLGGLMKKIDPEATVRSLARPADLEPSQG